jgi:TRAP-type mannitol/chloroaromatic compound transport system substrate-binding protein
MTDGAFEITPFGPGEVVPALQVMDAVGNGSVECGYTSAYYYLGKDPSLCIATCLPFGMSSRQLWSWLQEGGGKQALAEVYRDQGVIGIPAGNTGAQMGGWYRREINTVADLQGLKFRIAGFGGNILQKLGVVPQLIGGGDIYPALERGVIDGAEWVGPYDDEKLGFQRVARFYYAPGWWEYAPSIDMMVNPAAYEALPSHYKAILEAACSETWHWMMARYDSLNPTALRRLIAAGTQLRIFPREVLNASYRATQEFYAEVGAANPRFRRIHQTWDAYRLDQTQWFRIAEDTQANFLAAASAAAR